MARTHAIALFDKDSKEKNTIVLGVDLVIPLEADLDGDPEQDDEVRLKSVSGEYEQVLHAHDDNVELHPEKHVLLYTFRDVPRGDYTLSVKIGDQWSPVIPKLTVKKDGIFAGDAKLEGSIDEIATGEVVEPDVEEDDEQPHYPFYDQPEAATAED